MMNVSWSLMVWTVITFAMIVGVVCLALWLIAHAVRRSRP